MVCHSKLLAAGAKRGEDKYLPHALGQKGSGTVLGVGDSVKKLKPGDRVAWIKGSGLDVLFTLCQSSEGPVNSGAISASCGRRSYARIM